MSRSSLKCTCRDVLAFGTYNHTMRRHCTGGKQDIVCNVMDIDERYQSRAFDRLCYA